MGKTIENLAGRGIRAKVIHGGYQYSTYKAFAVKAGYPNAAHEMGTHGARTIDAKVLVGDYVNVLARGDHEFMNDTVYVCQTDSGSQFLIGKDGLKVVEKPATLTDATLDQLMAELKRRVEQAVADEEDTLIAEFMPEPQPQPSPIRTRANVVERAQWDVEGIVKRGSDYSALGGDGNQTYRTMLYNVEFIVNKEKRTVVALVRSGIKNNGQVIRHRGVAKCDPNDCFNEHIGKAIALRRAFELDVPSEYLNAPEPKGKQAGDIVSSDIGNLEVKDGGAILVGHSCHVNSFYAKEGTVIDDSARY